jgi:hypothetical protein
MILGEKTTKYYGVILIQMAISPNCKYFAIHFRKYLSQNSHTMILDKSNIAEYYGE